MQHLGPPPALRNSDMSTGDGSKPRSASWAARLVACSGRTTWRPSLTAFRPSASASSSFASISSANSRPSVARPASSNAAG